MYEQITVETDTWMPGQHIDETPDVPGDTLRDIQPYKYTDRHTYEQTDIWMDIHMDRFTYIQTDVQTHRYTNRHTDVSDYHPYVMSLCLHPCS